MTTTVISARTPVPPRPDGPPGFRDCRGQWHSTSDTPVPVEREADVRARS